MLTAENRTAKATINYFALTADYDSSPRWFGKGADALGLSGKIHTQEIFSNICNGFSPDGSTKLGRNIKRAALDLTFSVPKSVSLSALIGGDERLIDAHKKAVERTLKEIEKHHAQTRIRAKGTRYAVHTGNLVVAQFDHFESRELDPHLHTHALVMNLTQTQFGRWYSLNNGDIYKNKKILGMFYHVCLQDEVQKLGYEVEERPDGLFEIKGYKRKHLVYFSKRRQQIIQETGYGARWKTREEAWEITRKAKQHLPLDELKEMWLNQIQALGIVPVVVRSAHQLEEAGEQSIILVPKPSINIRR